MSNNSASVTAYLSAKDNMSSTLNRARNSVRALGSEIKSGFAFGVLTGMGQQAFSALANGAKGLINEIDSANAAWKTFTGNMQMLGKGEKEIAGVKKELQEFAQQTVYSSSDMATTFAQLEAVGTKNTAKLVKGFGGLAAAAENPQQAMKTLSTQATQMAAKPTVAWADFKLMLEQSPAGMAAVAKAMGMTAAELVKKVQAGEVATQDFLDTIAEVGTNKDFSKLATEAKTVGQAVDGLKETIGNKLTPAFEVLTQKGIKIINKLSDSFAKVNADKLAEKVGRAFDNIAKYAGALKSAFSGVGKEVWSAISEVASALTGMTGEFGSAESVDGFKSAMQSVADFIKGLAGFIKNNADAIAKLIKWLPAIAIGIKAFKVASAVAPAVKMFAKSIVSMASKAVGGIASKLFGISKAQTTVGKTSAASGTQMMTAAKAFALMGLAVLAISLGFALLAQSAIALANAGGAAIATMFGLVAALLAIGLGMGLLLKFLGNAGPQMTTAAMAMLILGVAIVLVAAGFAILAASAIALANAGGGAIAVMAGLVIALAGLMILFAVLGPYLTAGAVGMLAFGVAILLVGAGALLAAVGLAIIAQQLPLLCEYGLQGAVAILALGAALGVFALGAATAGLALVALATGIVVLTVAILGAAVAVVLLAGGVLALAGATLLLGVGLQVCAAALVTTALALPLVAVGALLATASLTALLAVSVAVSAIAAVLSAALLILSAAALAASVGVAAFGGAMIVAAAGTLLMAAALKMVSSQMKTIAKNAKAAQKSLKSMQSSVNAVESGLNALGSKAKSAMNKLTSAFDNAAGKAKSAGKKVGEAFTNGLRSGLKEAPDVAAQVAAQVSEKLKSGQSNAFSAGAFISQGFAGGMLSCLGIVQSAAAKLAAAADKAVKAKAKIHSPSKVADKLGQYWGEGLAGGISDMSRDVWNAAKELISLPAIQTPTLAMAYAGEMNAEYDYYRQSDYTIEVPLAVDGKEFARATASYTQDELDKRQVRDNRKHGKV